MSEGMSMRKAAGKWGIPHQSLSDRVHQKSQPRNQAHTSQQRLSEPEEARMVKWILQQEKLGYAPTASAVRAVAKALLALKGDSKPLGRKWVQHLKKRHNSIHTKKGTIQESVRYDCFTPKAVN